MMFPINPQSKIPNPQSKLLPSGHLPALPPSARVDRLDGFLPLSACDAQAGGGPCFYTCLPQAAACVGADHHTRRYCPCVAMHVDGHPTAMRDPCRVQGGDRRTHPEKKGHRQENGLTGSLFLSHNKTRFIPVYWDDR